MSKSTNSKSGSTRVPTAKIMAIIEKLNLKVDVRAGWILAFQDGFKSKRLLIHTGKRGTNCIELVGFESEFAVVHPCPPAKTMTQMLDCNIAEKEILRNFYKTAKLLTAQVVEAPKPVEVKEPEVQVPTFEQVQDAATVDLGGGWTAEDVKEVAVA